MIGETVQPTLPVSGHPWYHVTARDFAGNEGEASSIEDQLGIPGAPLPATYALRPIATS